MRLYSRTGATALDHPIHGHIEADEFGGFDFDDELSDQLHRVHVGGQPAWETEVERARRLATEDLARRQDPATLLALMEKFMQRQEPEAANSAPAAKRTARKAPAKEPE